MELLLVDVMVLMSPYVIIVCLITTISYGVYKGFENIARGGGVSFIILTIALVLEFILLAITPHGIRFKFMLPILENGILNIIKKGWPLTTFPYGETVTFAMLYSYVNQPSKVKKAAYLAIIVEGIFLCIINIIFIISLGAKYASIALFPHIVSMRIIKFGGFINRFDIVVVTFMIFAAFYKISILMYVSVLGTSQLLKLKSTVSLTIPFGILIAILSLIIARNYPEHIKLGLEFTVKYIHVPIQIVIPAITLIVYYLRNGFKKSNAKC